MVLAGALKFVALNGATLLAALGIASRLPLASRAERLLAACVVAVGLATISALALGLLGYLTYWPLLGVQVAFAAAGAGLARWRILLDFIDLRPALGLIRGWPQWVAFSSLLVVYAYGTFLGYISESFAGDALMYHLPIVAEYARTGHIQIPELGSYWANRYWAYYPGGAYLLYLWSVLPIGTGLLVDLVQLPYVLASALATYVLARILGARRHDAVWAALLLLAVPIVINQVKTALVDVVLTFLYAAGLAFLLQTPLNAARLVLAAIAWGAAPGVKLPAAMYMALGAIAVSLYQTDGERSLAKVLRKLMRIGAVLAAGTILLSGYWFARNWWLMGSATYPLNLTPEGQIAWSNIYIYGLLFPFIDFNPFFPDVFNYETGAGPQFIGLAVPALLALGAAGGRQRRLGLVALAAIPILAYGIWLYRLSTSVHTLLRYVVPAMPIGFAAFAWLLTRGPQRRVLELLAVVCVVFGVFVGGARLGTYIDPASLRYGLALWSRGEAKNRFDVLGSVELQDYRRGWNYIEGLQGSHEIAATHLVFAYPLMGADFRHRLHFPEAREAKQWLATLANSNVDHVALSQFVKPMATIEMDHGLRLDLDRRPTSDEYLSVTRSLSTRPVKGVRIRYRGDEVVNTRAFLGADRFAEVWELPMQHAGEAAERTIEWNGELTSLEIVFEFVPRTRMRAKVSFTVEELEVQDENGAWTSVLGSEASEWTTLNWPLEYYWMEARPERFKLVMRDVDAWHSTMSGEMRIYRVLPQGGDGGAKS